MYANFKQRNLRFFFRAGKLAIFEAYYFRSLCAYLMAQPYSMAAAPFVKVFFFYRCKFASWRPKD